MRDKIKYVFIVPIVRQVALDNVPLRNGPSSQKFSEEPMFIFFLQWELIIIIQRKWLILLLLDHVILYKPPKWPVLYDKCIRKSMVVCNLMRCDRLYFNAWGRYRFPVTFRPLPLTVCVYVVGASAVCKIIFEVLVFHF